MGALPMDRESRQRGEVGELVALLVSRFLPPKYILRAASRIESSTQTRQAAFESLLAVASPGSKRSQHTTCQSGSHERGTPDYIAPP